ncbi:flagellar hook-basal body complex protein FliE [Pengzhenrongella frigida]|uniref:Flagellar hook-basal body complex protein FliE n=1 Tax=Pengzhenrongella frigida TaxID=1259133 RepID=A0A4V1ZGX1_9MICO|nr:flagellar hook-basal body complex protein FliE [Cellulomonas sp. HLT2-17]RYV50024.1 flagellar hook-basal body complex protein FliE [Cellulomonas sp. HLT2-17]
MNIAAIGAISGVAGTGYLGAADAAAGVQTAGGAAFGNVMTASVDSLQGLQSTSDALAVKAVSGDLENVHDYTIASSEAKMTFELTAAVRNKAVEAFSEIMRMQA